MTQQNDSGHTEPSPEPNDTRELPSRRELREALAREQAVAAQRERDETLRLQAAQYSREAERAAARTANTAASNGPVASEETSPAPAQESGTKAAPASTGTAASEGQPESSTDGTWSPEPVADEPSVVPPADKNYRVSGRKGYTPSLETPNNAEEAHPLDDVFADLTPKEGPDTVTAKPRSRAPKNPHAKRKTKRVVISLVVTAALLGALVWGGSVLWSSFGEKINDLFGWNQEVIDYEGEGHGQVTITIVAGDTGSTIGETLATNGVVKTAEAFVNEVSITKPEPSFFPGTYQLRQEMSAAAALTALQDPANKIEMKAVIPEGTQMSQIFATLEAVTGIPNADFVAAAADPTQFGVPATAPSLEGWLFPATYELSDTDTATTIIQKLVDRTIQSLDAAGVPEAERENVLIIASIIQREARHTDDFYMVSRVIQNRLDQGIKLGMDSTVKYGLSDDASSVWSTDAQLTDDNPWNTYVHTGLPIGPISNPGDLAIDAAMNPTPGDWLFFVTVNQDTGETLFSTTNAEHEELVAQAKQWCSDNPDNPAC